MATRSTRRPTRTLTLLASALAAGALAVTVTPAAAAATAAAPGSGGHVAHPMPWDSHAGTDGFHDGG